MKHIIFTALFIIRLGYATEYYVTPDGQPVPGLHVVTTDLQTAARFAEPGDVIYLFPGIYTSSPNSSFLLEYYGDGGDETRGPITFKSYYASNPAVFKAYEEELPLGEEPNPNVGNWALVKIYPRLVEGRLYIPKYLTFENIIFEGNAKRIFMEEEARRKAHFSQPTPIPPLPTPPYELQPGAYCESITPEGYVNNTCASFSKCIDSDGDGVFNDNAGCEQAKYNCQGLLVTGPFNWDGAINSLINRRKPNGAVISGINNYAIPHHITVRGCTFRYFPGAGLSFQRSDYITVENCIVANNCWYTIFGSSGLNFYQMVPYEGPNVDYSKDGDYRIKIRNNVCYGNSLRVENQNLVVRYDGNGIIIDDFTHEQDYRTLSEINTHRATFGRPPLDQNPTNPNRGYFYYGPYKGKTLVSNNVVYGNGGSGLKVYSSQYVDVIHNTFYNNGIGNYRNTRTGVNQPPLGWLRPQNSLFVQAIVDETASEPKPTIMPGYNKVYNNITYNTLGYNTDHMPSHYLDCSIALGAADMNEAANNFNASNNHSLDPQFLKVPTLDLLNNKEVSGDVNFKVEYVSAAVNYGVYIPTVPEDISGYLRGVPDAGAFETDKLCYDKVVLGSTVTTIPAGQSNKVLSGQRKVYNAAKSITFNGVYSTQAGAVLNTQIVSCNKQLKTFREAHTSYEIGKGNTTVSQSLQYHLAYPNPVKGTLYFTEKAGTFELRTVEGVKVLSGIEGHSVSVEGIMSGLYLLNIDGKVQKIVIE